MALRARRSLCAVCLLTLFACSGDNEPSVATGSATGAGSSSKPAAGGSGGSAGKAATSSSAPAAMSGGFSPLCSDVPVTAAGQAPAKGGACTAGDSQLCYKTCGPQSVGFKSETCTNGAYAEQTGCTFPDADYGCYKIPGAVDKSCPSTPPQATKACDVAPCTVCSAGGNYLDSSGASKQGYCVCPMAGDSGVRNWSCASSTAWPCPSGKGC